MIKPLNFKATLSRDCTVKQNSSTRLLRNSPGTLPGVAMRFACGSIHIALGVELCSTSFFVNLEVSFPRSPRDFETLSSPPQGSPGKINSQWNRAVLSYSPRNHEQNMLTGSRSLGPGWRQLYTFTSNAPSSFALVGLPELTLQCPAAMLLRLSNVRYPIHISCPVTPQPTRTWAGAFFPPKRR